MGNTPSPTNSGIQEERAQLLREEEQDALRQSEARFRLLASATFEGVAITEGGRIRDVNNQLLEMLGYEKTEDIVGKSPIELTPPEYRKVVAEHTSAGNEEPYESMLISWQGSGKCATMTPIRSGR